MTNCKEWSAKIVNVMIHAAGVLKQGRDHMSLHCLCVIFNSINIQHIIGYCIKGSQYCFSMQLKVVI